MKWLRGLILSLLAVCLVSCGRTEPAPVFSAWKQPKTAGLYRVQPGDTLYSVAFAYGFDYREVALVNHLQPPYTIHPGERLIIKRSLTKPITTHLKKPTKLKPVVKIHPQPQKQATHKTKKHHHVAKPKPVHRLRTPRHWRWPVKAKVLQRFKKGYGLSQGIELAGWKGRSIVASAPGQVVYSGTGVRGYGNLIIIKHSEEYLSAYAYASKRLVRAGQWVKAGQRIAEMGRDSYGRVRLHFEIRKNGTPVNPLRYLH